MGATVVVAGRHAVVREGLLRSTALHVLLSVQILIWLPAFFFSVARLPEWSVMYLVKARELPDNPWILASVGPLVAVMTFAVARQLVVSGKVRAAYGLTLGSVAVALAVIGFGHRQILHLGTTDGFHLGSGAGEAVAPAVSAAVRGGLLAPALGAALLLPWGFGLWRLAIFGRAVLRFGERGGGEPGQRVGTRKQGAPKAKAKAKAKKAAPAGKAKAGKRRT